MAFRSLVLAVATLASTGAFVPKDGWRLSIFREYGWDWTYHAFREWTGWSVEHETASPKSRLVHVADTPRRRVLLDGFRGLDTVLTPCGH